ncbi:MAG TPA: hypothetical protein VFK31_09385 [Rhodanobacteraceae bacterium]|nr:hypothetical protein [Rhodanobacteraceae bacterium]
MRRSIAFVLSLGLSAVLAGGAHAVTPTQDQPQAYASPMIQFQRDLVNVLALRSEAEPLLGAALLARTLPDPPDYVSFHALIQRAAKAPDAGPGIAWAQLVDCDAEADACPDADALATLKKKAPDNAAVWLMVLGQAVRHDDEDAARAALAKAARASRYDDYAGISLAALARAASALPPPAGLYGKQGAASSAAGVRALLVFGLSNFQPLPGFQAAARLCKDGKDDKPLRQQCLALAKILAWASSPLARSLGLHLQQTLSDDADLRRQARAARHDLVWQVHNFGELVLQSQHQPEVARTLLDLARNGGTRMSLILAALRAEHIPVDAPAGWEPRRKQAR